MNAKTEEIKNEVRKLYPKNLAKDPFPGWDITIDITEINDADHTAIHELIDKEPDYEIVKFKMYGKIMLNIRMISVNFLNK